MKGKVIVSCEHARNHVPARWRPLLTPADERGLESHRGWDRGALPVARALGRLCEGPVIEGTITRLLVDLNRREGNHTGLFGAVGARLDADERERLLVEYHRPYRERVLAAVAEGLRNRRRVVFLSVHSFTPVMRGVSRNTDVAVLYDPARPAERRLADAILAPFAEAGLSVRRNYPYRGVTDGVATALRKRFADAGARLVPVEVEYCHRLFDNGWTPPLLAKLTAKGVASFED